MSTLTQADANKAIQDVLKRAATDADFNSRALANPSAAVKEVTGKDLPTDFTLRFVANSGADLTIVLPDAVSSTEELSDSELEQVAGGRCAGSCGGSCVMMSS